MTDFSTQDIKELNEDSGGNEDRLLVICQLLSGIDQQFSDGA